MEKKEEKKKEKEKEALEEEEEEEKEEEKEKLSSYIQLLNSDVLVILLSFLTVESTYALYSSSKKDMQQQISSSARFIHTDAHSQLLSALGSKFSLRSALDKRSFIFCSQAFIQSISIGFHLFQTNDIYTTRNLADYLKSAAMPNLKVLNIHFGCFQNENFSRDNVNSTTLVNWTSEEIVSDADFRMAYM